MFTLILSIIRTSKLGTEFYLHTIDNTQIPTVQNIYNINYIQCTR